MMASEFSECADFLSIYIEEGHTIDILSISDSYKIHQHKTIEDRLKAAKKLLEWKPSVIPIVVDKMEGDANSAYGGFFERHHIVLDGKMVYVGGHGPMYYSSDKVRDWLVKHTSKNC